MLFLSPMHEWHGWDRFYHDQPGPGTRPRHHTGKPFHTCRTGTQDIWQLIIWQLLLVSFLGSGYLAGYPFLCSAALSCSHALLDATPYPIAHVRPQPGPTSTARQRLAKQRPTLVIVPYQPYELRYVLSCDPSSCVPEPALPPRPLRTADVSRARRQ